MKPYLIYLTVLILMVLFASSASGQKHLLEESIYFESAKYDLTTDSKIMLDHLIDSLKKIQHYQIFIKGNTDNVGDSTYNKKLSEQRVTSTEEYLISNGILKNAFSTLAFGEENPIVDNLTDQGKQKNRRVDILVSAFPNDSIDSTRTLPSIFELYKQTEIEPEQFCINPSRDTVLRCSKGTIVYVKANSFKIPYSCKTKCLTIMVKEVFQKSEMILENLSTTSNGQLIETQGMIYTEAKDCFGNNLKLSNGKDLVIFVPTDTIVPETKIFQGNRTPHDSIMNWTVSNTSVLGNFTLDELNECSDWICGGIVDSCDRCKFFSCRIKRIGIAFKGIWDKSTRIENTRFKNCQKKLKRERKSERKLKSNGRLPQSTILIQRPNLEPELLTKCEELENLYKKYGVQNTSALIKAINKPLMDSLGVKTIKALKDTMSKISIKNFETAYLNKSISYDDFKYYVYNTSQLGWSNLDVFVDIPIDNLVDMKINLKIASNIDCKLVFIDRRFVIPPKKIEGNYTFEKLPKGERIWIVAIKYEEGKPFLSMQETIVANETYNVDFKLMTLEELKLELRKLDQ